MGTLTVFSPLNLLLFCFLSFVKENYFLSGCKKISWHSDTFPLTNFQLLAILAPLGSEKRLYGFGHIPKMTAFPNSRLVKNQFGFFRKKEEKKALLDDWSTLKLPPPPSQNAPGSAFTPVVETKDIWPAQKPALRLPLCQPCALRHRRSNGCWKERKKTSAGSEH